MLYDPKRNLLILNMQQPHIVTAAIPTARLFQYNGQTLVAVPYNIREVYILNSLHIKVQSPIRTQYSWPNSQGYLPYHAQLETADFLTMHRNAFVLNELGTGKTLASLWAADYLMEQGLINKVLIVAPLSTLNRVWGDALWIDFPHRKFEVLHNPNAKKRIQLLDKDADFYIINFDGTKVIYDEYRKVGTDKFDAMRNLRGGRGIWGLTGTPTPNAPTDAFAQCKLVCPENIPTYFKQFREMTMIKFSEYKWLPKPDALDRVYKVMQPSIRFTRDECYDLPEAVSIDLEVELSSEQKKAYKEMRKSFYTEFNNGEIVAANEGVKMSKLIQIAAGVVYDAAGEAQVLPCKSRLEVLLQTIEQANSKIIVFVPYTVMTHMVEHFLKSKGYSTARVDGSVSAKARDKIFGDFQASPDPHILIAHPKCMSHGLTLTEASTIVWYAPYLDSGVVEQANGRIRRAGQKNKQAYVYLQGSEIERRVYKNQREKRDLQGTLLEMFETNQL